MLQYCSKAVPKTGKRDVEERGLEVRSMPAGYTYVPMGSFLSQNHSRARPVFGSIRYLPWICCYWHTGAQNPQFTGRRTHQVPVPYESGKRQDVHGVCHRCKELRDDESEGHDVHCRHS